MASSYAESGSGIVGTANRAADTLFGKPQDAMAKPMTPNERFGLQFVKFMGIIAAVGYPMYKLFFDGAREISGRAALVWIIIGLVVIIGADRRVHCAPTYVQPIPQ